MPATLPDIDVGSAPTTDDPNEAMEWWGDALDALRDHMDDWTHAMIGSHTMMKPRYERQEVTKTDEREVMRDGEIQMEQTTWTEEETVPVGEKTVCSGHYIDVEITSAAERKAAIALAESAGLTVEERHGATRFDYRLEADA